MSIMKDVEKRLGLTRCIVRTGVFPEGMRRNNGKYLIQIAGFREEFEDRPARLQKRSATKRTAKFCLYKQLCKAAFKYGNFT
jgi:hypothetical protein